MSEAKPLDPRVETLLASWLRPERAALVKARALLDGVTSVEEYWERAYGAGLVSSAFYGAEKRFATRAERWCLDGVNEGTCGAATCPACDARRWVREARETPCSLRACLTVASDAQGMHTAEMLAREVCARMDPKEGWPREPRVVWRFQHRERVAPHRSLDALFMSREHVWNHWRDEDEYFFSDDARLVEVMRRLGLHTDNADTALWPAWLGSVVGVGESFGPYAELLARGYALQAVCKEEGAVVLAAPMVEFEDDPTLGAEDGVLRAALERCAGGALSSGWVWAKSYALTAMGDFSEERALRALAGVCCTGEVPARAHRPLEAMQALLRSRLRYAHPRAIASEAIGGEIERAFGAPVLAARVDNDDDLNAVTGWSFSDYFVFVGTQRVGVAGFNRED